MIKVEAVVIRERVETVIDAVEHETGHVGVTVIEAIGHGRQRGVTHEYRGRVFESRFLPKAHLTFIVKDELADAVVAAIADSARSGNESGDGLVWTTPVDERHAQPDRQQAWRRWKFALSNKDLAIAASTIWVVIAAVLVMFMQAGFAFLEAGLTRMKNVGHIAAKNVLIFAPRFRRLLPRRLRARVRRRRQRAGRRLRVRSLDRRARSRSGGAVLVVRVDPGRSRLPVRGRLLRGARSRSSGERWPNARGSGSTSRSAIVFTLLYSVVSHWIWHPDGWLFAHGHAGLRRFHGRALPGRARRSRRSDLCSARGIGKFSSDGQAERDSRAQHGRTRRSA